jgi:hypothetical protein
MQKRGQITVFVILGIVIIVSIILVVTLKGSTVKSVIEKEISGTSSFSEHVEEVEGIVQGCLDRALKKSVITLAVENPLSYKEKMASIIKAEIYDCADFEGISVKVTTGIINNIDLNYVGAGGTKISARLDFDIKIEQGKIFERLDEFYTETSIVPDCCVSVVVNKDCEAEEDTKAVSCGRILNVKKGESLKEGGKCLAC